MVDPGLLRFLELVVRELSASDARVELGGRDPEDPRFVFRVATNGGRVVVVFDAPPPNRAAIEARLATLVDTLYGATDHTQSPASARTPPDFAGRRLDDELERLSERAGASGAIVFDLASPIVWGASRARADDREKLYQSLIDRVREAHSELRQHHTSRLRVNAATECLVRPFAGLYYIALAFDTDISEPVALGALVHAMPSIERLVLALPPLDPPPGGAKIVRMPARLR
ncbi:MAG TPA: hypothetical protein VHC69_29245 [Polyangiaceae bacterium]|nr:hypothetical protein [Polyangiaceae bacterium]